MRELLLQLDSSRLPTAFDQLVAYDAAVDGMFGQFRLSIMLDSNGSNTTAVAAVVKIEQALGSLTGKKVVILAGTGPVGQRAAGLLAKDGARVTITSRKPEQGEKARQFINARFSVQVESATLADPSQLPRALDGAAVLLNAGAAGIQIAPRAAWTGVKTLKIAVDLKADPPLGIEGVVVHTHGISMDDASS